MAETIVEGEPRDRDSPTYAVVPKPARPAAFSLETAKDIVARFPAELSAESLRQGWSMDDARGYFILELQARAHTQGLLGRISRFLGVRGSNT